jgi:excisionase family DNA binding protein
MSGRTPTATRQPILDGHHGTRTVPTPSKKRVPVDDATEDPSRRSMNPTVYHARDRGDDDRRARLRDTSATGRSRGAASFLRITAHLTDLAQDIEQIERWAAHQRSALWCQLAAFQNVLAARCVRDLQISHEMQARDSDRLLTVDEAAARLACSTDWLYRHHHRLGFAVRNGRHLRFSANGLDRYIRERAGRERTSLPPERER